MLARDGIRLSEFHDTNDAFRCRRYMSEKNNLRILQRRLFHLHTALIATGRNVKGDFRIHSCDVIVLAKTTVST